MERPPARPEGALIRLAREAARMSIPDAVKLSGVSKARWSQVETGYETRGGVTRLVQAKAGTLAQMAHAVGLSPERLRTEGQRADAADVLAEILRSQAQQPGIPLAGIAVAVSTAEGDADAAPGEDDPAAYLFPDDAAARAAFRGAYSQHRVVLAIWAQTGMAPEDRALEIRGWLTARAQAEQESRRNAGLGTRRDTSTYYTAQCNETDTVGDLVSPATMIPHIVE